MKVTTTNIANITIIKVEGSLILENLKEFEKAIEKAYKNGHHIIIDFSELSFICSAGLSLLIMSFKRAERLNLKMIISNCNNDILKLFNLTELNQHLKLADTVEDARRIIEESEK